MFALGNFSAYSFHGAAWPVAGLAAAARAAGYAGAGLADMGGFYGGVEFSQACAREGLRMVLGCRLQVRDFAPGWLQVTARDQTGYTAACRLAGEATAGEVDWEALERLQAEAAGHVWLSCPVRAGHVYGSRAGAWPRWLEAWERLLRRGWDNLWLELGWHNEAERLLQRRVYGEWRRRGWDRWVVMAGARHDGSVRGRRLLELLQAIGTLTRLGQPHPDKLPQGDYGLPPPAALRARFARVPEVLERTREFAEACEFDYAHGRFHLPEFPRQDRQLAWRCLRGLARRYGPSCPWPDKPARGALLERLRRELAVVAETGYAGYFLVFAEVVDECARRGIPVLARGSAAGSLICHALGVSNVCPFRFGLSFERFLNRERLRHSKLPDIDLDLPWDRRDEIIGWLCARHGLERAAMIGGFARFQGRAAVAATAAAMGVPAHEARAWTRRLPHGSLRRFLEDPDSHVEAAAAMADPRFREAVGRAADLHGLPQHPMMHPCGMVVSARPLAEFTPVGRSAKGFPMTQLAMEPVEDLGLLKLDLLGQAGLSVLRDCRDNLRAEAAAARLATDGPADPRDPFRGMDHADPRIFKWIQAGEARGVFHIESPAMTGLLRLCRCSDIDCLVAAVSVIRPGAANEDKKTRFARRQLGLEPPQYAHPVLEEVLRDTHGLLVYEEHILLVANRFAGMDFGVADLLRRILVKKADDDALGELEAVFRASALRAGRTEAEIAAVWHELRDFSGYMFNKAHGAAYAIEAHRGCWLKFHWPVHFLAAVLNNQRGFYTPLVYVLEILRHGGRFTLPDVNWPGAGYRVEAGRVRVPLWQVKGLGERFLDTWARERARAPFAGWADFLARARPEPAEALALARAGALEAFFPDRHEAAWQAVQAPARGGAGAPEPDLFGAPGRRAAAPLPLMGAGDMALAEAELLGFPVTLGPLELWMRGIDRAGTVPVAALARHTGREVEVAGLQVCQRLHRTTSGRLMKFVSLADESGIAEAALFPEAYRRLGWQLAQSRAARLRVRVEPDATASGLSLTVTDACF